MKAEAPVEGYRKVVERGEMGLQYLEFGLIHLTDGEWSGATAECEYALDIHSGVISLEIVSPGLDSYKRLGGRKDVFDDLPTVVYLPPNVQYRITVDEGPADIAVFSSIAKGFNGGSKIIDPKDISVESHGRNNWRWEVHTAIGEKFFASKLLMGEALVPPGNWANIPPHKHDAFIPPREMLMEEIYYFKATPVQGFGMMRIYTAPNDPGRMDEAFVIEDGDMVVIPRGYHPLVAAPGYSLNYTWAMAGNVRKYGAWTFDPRHDWIF